MKMEMPCLDLDYMELDEEDRLTDQDALMLGIVREVDQEGAYMDLAG